MKYEHCVQESVKFINSFLDCYDENNQKALTTLGSTFLYALGSIDPEARSQFWEKFESILQCMDGVFFEDREDFKSYLENILNNNKLREE